MKASVIIAGGGIGRLTLAVTQCQIGASCIVFDVLLRDLLRIT